MFDVHGVDAVEYMLLFFRFPNVRHRLAVFLVECFQNIVLPAWLVLHKVPVCWGCV